MTLDLKPGHEGSSAAGERRENRGQLGQSFGAQSFELLAPDPSQRAIERVHDHPEWDIPFELGAPPVEDHQAAPSSATQELGKDE
jgi:hypothetical protein